MLFMARIKNSNLDFPKIIVKLCEKCLVFEMKAKFFKEKSTPKQNNVVVEPTNILKKDISYYT